MLNPFRKRPELIVHSTHPLNAEPPLPKLRATYLTPQDLLYVRSHGDIPKLDGAAHRVSIGGRVARKLSLSLADVRVGLPVRRLAPPARDGRVTTPQTDDSGDDGLG